ncbi:peptide-N(4)-(N-acetyl-beta-glucosaminyl)asparagine amidase [Aethina tumida]|uniref:peptide-N(4)-(N-acetyl-beta- glucosaminyl)asparagine amidase n=1 Tax=Aethina tumida TaxID=116153 RepID=UPI00096AE543|nr:peptide-N(4)-(N-acetyl-beta-glucosaminyl)asparagine amidase [Aethina tumida]XP_049817249.1 peptide-N(4)-(N-acetyl-beta-glucosaminyl)asparagine amidase [Aethina tumida]
MIKHNTMSWDTVKQSITSNKKEEVNESIRLLIKISENIINNPEKPDIRTLRKSNKTISSKVLAINGGLDCLQLMGFKDEGDSLTMPFNSSLTHLRIVKNDLQLLQQDIINGVIEVGEKVIVTATQEEIIRQVELPPLVHIFTNPFLKHIETQHHLALVYEDETLQERARKLMPIVRLEDKAVEHLRNIQKEIKKKNINDLNVSLQDILILELLAWFKNTFFTWVDTLDCSSCGGKTKVSHTSKDEKLLVYTQRVEMHQCTICKQFTPFPRYNDLNILLETRKGRCGEWANTFTLFSRAMGWDARLVEAIDEDHVWTEVYSFSQKRWLHCDPCENVCDRPLMYECGWGKKLSYVMAYSGEEVQDVTWRYSAQHKQVLQRRRKCHENELVDALIQLRTKRQANLTEPRRQYLIKRLLFELLEFLIEQKPNNEDSQGRTSGNLEWRLARSEIQSYEPYTWIVDQVPQNYVTIKYSSSLDVYELSYDDDVKVSLKGWSAGAYYIENVFRKEETDWKMVYLCRTEGSDKATISWKFNVTSGMVIDTIDLTFDWTVFETGIVETVISAENLIIQISKDVKAISHKMLSGKTEFIISAILKNGNGDMAWQHTQLFRQASDCDKFPFIVKLTFRGA